MVVLTFQLTFHIHPNEQASHVSLKEQSFAMLKHLWTIIWQSRIHLVGMARRLCKRVFSFWLRSSLLIIFVVLLLRCLGLLKSDLDILPLENLPSHVNKALIIASQSSSNISWLPSAAAAGNWSLHTYITDGGATSLQPLTVPSNKGNEAMVYLTYIIDNYHSLPDIMFFHHHHESAWHQTYPSPTELEFLNPFTVLDQGYVSTRCLSGCENVIELSGETVPVNQLVGRSRDVQIASVLKEFMYAHEELPKKIAAPCCAQFVVSRDAVLERELETWVGLRKWLMETRLDSQSSGRVLEYTWHIWFGMEDIL